nr:MAG TPA: hypothetical protein [Caudoviricetes sp.]
MNILTNLELNGKLCTNKFVRLIKQKKTVTGNLLRI